MELNILGLISALAAFLSIWWGHVVVRKIEAISTHLWHPMLGALVLGILAEMIALQADDINLSASCGIAGAVLLWDVFEFYRQQNRIKRGHAPANLNNPRHARILAQYPAASSIDWLARNPRGKPYTEEELNTLKASVK